MKDDAVVGWRRSKFAAVLPWIGVADAVERVTAHFGVGFEALARVGAGKRMEAHRRAVAMAAVQRLTGAKNIQVAEAFGLAPCGVVFGRYILKANPHLAAQVDELVSQIAESADVES